MIQHDKFFVHCLHRVNPSKCCLHLFTYFRFSFRFCSQQITNNQNPISICENFIFFFFFGDQKLRNVKNVKGMINFCRTSKYDDQSLSFINTHKHTHTETYTLHRHRSGYKFKFFYSFCVSFLLRAIHIPEKGTYGLLFEI